MPSTPDVLALLRARREALPPALRRVADYVLESPSEVVHMSTSQLAREAGSSEAAVSRLCERVGLPGYPALKSDLAVWLSHHTESPSANVAEIGAGASPEVITDVVARAHTDAIRLTAHAAAPEQVVAVVDVLRRSSPVIIIGLASSTPVAHDLATKLVMAGHPATATSDRHFAAALVARHGADCALVVLSTSGSTKDTVSLAEVAAAQGTPVVAITSDITSRLARTADHVLQTSAYESGLRSGGTSDRIAQLLLVDILTTVLRIADHSGEVAAMQRMDEAVTRWRLS